MRTPEADRREERPIMSETLDLNELERSAYRESEQDGLAELALGITVLAWAAFVAFRGPFTAALVVALLLLQPRAWGFVRARLTHPRIGRVRLRPDKARSVLPGVLSYIALIVALMAIAFMLFGSAKNPALWWRWLPFFVGMMLVGALAHAHSRSGSPRYTVFALLAAGAGLAVSLVHFPSPERRLVVYLLGMGFFFALAGTVVLVRFLRQHPVAAECSADTTGRG